MRQRVTVLDHRFPNLDPERRVLGQHGIEVVDAGGLEPERALALAADADGILLGARLPLTRERLQALPRCRVIVRYGIGFDNVDVDAARELGMAIGFVPDYCVEEVANHTIALLLALHRQLNEFEAWARAGKSGLPRDVSIPRLSECALGLVGLGRIGREVAARARPLGLTIRAYDPALSPAGAQEAGVELLELDLLVETCDVVSLHVPLVPGTRRIFDTRRIARMKPGALLVNVSRGGLIDESALAVALHERRIGGAAIDTSEQEPIDAASPLLGAPNAILTPHVAWFSEGARRELQANAAEEAGRVLGGKPLRNAAAQRPAGR